jgi:hypothetical protein
MRRRMSMRSCLRKHIWTLTFLLCALATGWPQATDGARPADSDAQDTVNRADSGQDSEPLSPGLNSTSTTPSVPSPSYVLGDLQVSTGMESNPSLSPAYSSQISSATRLLGNASLRKFRRHFETSVDYVGSDTLFQGYGSLKLYNFQFQQLNADQTIRWRSGKISFDDSFTYTGNQGVELLSPGGSGAFNNPGGSNYFGGTQFGTTNESNVSVASITQDLTKHSSAKFSGAYSITDYLGSSQGLFNSRQVSTQTGYGYQISRKTNIGFSYGYRDFQFIPNLEALVANSAQLIFQFRFSDRMELIIGAGPQRIVTSGLSRSSQLTPTVQASFRYRSKRSDLNLSYNRSVSSGAGFYAGGIEQIAVSSFDWRFSRSWQATLSGSYFRVSEVGLSAPGTQSLQTEYGLAGAVVRRRLGRYLSAIASYELNYYRVGGCSLSQSCNPAVYPNRALIGLDWSFRPVRLE